MAEVNGKNNWQVWVIRTLVACLWGGIVIVMQFMGNKIYANEDKAVREHTAIRSEVALAVEKLEAKFDQKLDKIDTQQRQDGKKIERILTILERRDR